MTKNLLHGNLNVIKLHEMFCSHVLDSLTLPPCIHTYFSDQIIARVKADPDELPRLSVSAVPMVSRAV